MGRDAPILRLVDDTVLWCFQAVILDAGQEGQTVRMGLVWDSEDGARGFADNRLWTEEDAVGTYIVQKINEETQIRDLMRHLLDRNTEVFAFNAPALDEGTATLMKCNDLPNKIFTLE
jgi:hypothetical protein